MMAEIQRAEAEAEVEASRFENALPFRRSSTTKRLITSRVSETGTGNRYSLVVALISARGRERDKTFSIKVTMHLDQQICSDVIFNRKCSANEWSRRACWFTRYCLLHV